jgi:hypothetical protein
MDDVQYEATFVPQGRAAQVERMSTLWPICKRRDYGIEQVQTSLNYVLSLWRRRLSVLYRGGCDAVPDELHLGKMRNCHPAGVGVVVPGRAVDECPWCCHSDYFCPWCWARRAGQVYRDLSGLLPGRWDPNRHHALFLLSARYTAKAGGWGDKVLHEVLLARNADLATKLKQAKAFAGVRVSTLMPWKDKFGVERWVFGHKLLLLYSAGSRPPRSVLEEYAAVEAEPVSRRQLRNAVARCFRYPVGLLFGPPAKAALALKARKGLRLYECTGALRKQ